MSFWDAGRQQGPDDDPRVVFSAELSSGTSDVNPSRRDRRSRAFKDGPLRRAVAEDFTH